MTLEPPLNMNFGPVRLIFDTLIEVEPGGELVSFYHFKVAVKDGKTVGHINFKIGDTRHIRQCVGHIGYEILPQYRGNHYSYFACNAIRPFVKKFYNKVILTSDPDNKASIKTIERLNAVFLNEILVPQQDPSYKNGSRRKKRYEWEP